MQKSLRCSKCKQDKPADQFAPSAPMWPDHRECHTCSTTRSQRARHGLTQEQRQQIADAQGGCAICGHADPGSKGWVIDHDHGCCEGGKSCQKCRRGVLCQYCNSMLGMAFDRVQILAAGIEYLTRYRDRSASECSGWHKPIPCDVRLCTYAPHDAPHDAKNDASHMPT